MERFKIFSSSTVAKFGVLFVLILGLSTVFFLRLKTNKVSLSFEPYMGKWGDVGFDLGQRFIMGEDGIVLMPYKVTESGKFTSVKNHEDADIFQQMPMLIGQYALGRYAQIYYGNSTPEVRQDFFRHADWFVEKQNPQTGTYPVNFNWADIKAPWISAMYQGRAMSVLARGYYLSGDEKYIDVAKLAFKPFRLDISEGGVVDYLEGFPIYEEYPGSADFRHVLNGFIFSLFGLWDFYQVTGDAEVLEKFNAGVDTLVQKLYLWEFDNGSYYQLGNSKSFSSKYHPIHVRQLAYLYDITGNEFFWDKALAWDAKTEDYVLKDRPLLETVKGIGRKFLQFYRFPPGFRDISYLFSLFKEESLASK